MARKRVERNLAFDEEKGLYYACFDYGRDGTGRRVRQTKCFRDRTAAQEALCQFELKRQRRQLQLPSRLTVGEWLDYWLEQIIRPNREDTTYYCYRGMARNHIIPALGQVPLQQLDPYRIQRYYGDMLQRKSLGANTVYKHHILLHTALKAAFRQGILPDNPVDRVEPPRLCSPRQYFYTPEQLRTLFHAVVGTRLELVVKLAGYLGLRRSEICGLRWENVDLEHYLIHICTVRTTAGGSVVQKQPKTAHSIRKLGIAGLDDLVGLLIRERERQEACCRMDRGWTDSGYVIVREDGKPYDPNRVTGAFHQFIQERGLPPITIHGLRHTFASLANSARVPLLDIGKTLGHKDCTITGRVYTHIFDQTHQEVLNTVAACIATKAM